MMYTLEADTELTIFTNGTGTYLKKYKSIRLRDVCSKFPQDFIVPTGILGTAFTIQKRFDESGCQVHLQ